MGLELVEFRFTISLLWMLLGLRLRPDFPFLSMV